MDTLNHETMRASRNVILNRKTLIELFTNQELRVFAEKMYIKSYLMQGQTMDLSRKKKFLDLCDSRYHGAKGHKNRKKAE